MTGFKIQQRAGQVSDGYHTFDELYMHRNTLFLLLMSQNRDISWASKTHKDGTKYDGWFVAGMRLATGDVSYHMPDQLWPCIERMGIHNNEQPEWDGHTSEDVLLRLMTMVHIDA